MRIRIKEKVPVSEEHGIKVGNEYEATTSATHRGAAVVQGATGEPVTILYHEYEKIEDEE